MEKLGINSNNILPLPNVVLDDPYLALLDKNRRDVPESSPQSAPDLVLNPLSIFRMARSHIPEGHALESAPRDLSQPAGAQTALTALSGGTTAVEHPMSSPNDVGGEAYNNTFEDFGLDLDMFFAPDAELNWQSAEMVVGSGVEGDGVMPWVGMSQLGDFVFDPPQP